MVHCTIAQHTKVTELRCKQFHQNKDSPVLPTAAALSLDAAWEEEEEGDEDDACVELLDGSIAAALATATNLAASASSSAF